MKIIVKRSHENDEGLKVNNVEINGEEFYDIPNVANYDVCRNCNFRGMCDYGERVVRKIDCKKNANCIKRLFDILTGIVVAIVAFLIYNKLNYSFFVETAALLCFMTFFDAFCCFVGFIAKIRRDKLFYKKLKKQKKEKEELLERTKVEKEEKRKQEEMQTFIEEFEELKNNPEYSKIKLTQDYVENVKEFANSIDFGTYNQKINVCIQNLEEIVKILENNNSKYNSLIELFEIYLPNFYKTLRLYSNFITEKTVTPEYEKILGKSVTKFAMYLEKVKQEVTFERGSNAIQFETTAETLTNLIDAEGGL